jgi:hypothetical protein
MPHAEFGDASSQPAPLDPHAWLSGFRAVTGLPADFLVAADRHILARKYGVQAATSGRWTTPRTLPASTSRPPIIRYAHDPLTQLTGSAATSHAGLRSNGRRRRPA